MKKNIIILIILLLGSSGLVLAAPAKIYHRHLYPEIDSTYEFGTSSQAWLRITADNLVVDSATTTGSLYITNDLNASTSKLTILDMPEIDEPAIPATNDLRLYVEGLKGFSFFKYIDDTGMKRELLRDSMILVKNTRGATIAANRIVYATSSEDNIPLVNLAKADSASTMPAIGVTIESIADGAYGRVMQVGLLENINTDSLTEGDILYVSDVTAGVPTINPPLSPNLTQEIGTVLVKSATVGAVQVVARGLTGDEYGTSQNIFLIGDGAAGDKTLTFNADSDASMTWDSANSYISIGDDLNITGNVTTTGYLHTDSITFPTASTYKKSGEHSVYIDSTFNNLTLNVPTGERINLAIGGDNNVQLSGSMLFSDNNIQFSEDGDNYLYFDSGIVKYLMWDDSEDHFALSNGLYIAGNATTTGAFSVGTDNLVVRDNGNIGIGTTSPNQELDLSGNLELEDTTSNDTGVIYKESNSFIHNFHHPTGDTHIPAGQNIFVGENAGNFTLGSGATQTYHGSHLIGMGFNALLDNTTGYSNLAFGSNALRYNTTGFYNLALGSYPLYNNTVGYYNTAIGANALYNNEDGIYNLAIGPQAMRLTTTSDYNIGIGPNALYYNINGEYNTAVGPNALRNNTDGIRNVAIGPDASYKSKTVDYGVAIGNKALYYNTVGDQNTGLGASALYWNTTANYNTGAGYTTLYNNTMGTGNTGFGHRALYGVKPTSGPISEFSDYGGVVAGTVRAKDTAHGLVGVVGGIRIAGTTNYNGIFTITVIDADHFYFTDTWVANDATGWWGKYLEAQYNIGLGYAAGDNITIGSNNIIIGYNIDAPDATEDDQLNIGNAVYGDLDTGNVGIATTTFPYALTVEGDVLADSYLEYSPLYVGDAVKAVKNIRPEQGNFNGDWGKVDHNTLPEEIKVVKEVEYTEIIGEETVEYWDEMTQSTKTKIVPITNASSYEFVGRNMGKSVQLNLRAIQQLIEKVEALEAEVEALKAK